MPPRKILFVDDDPYIGLLLPTRLRHRGYDVRTAATVREALAEINEQTFDVLISDLNIGHPGDGFAVVSAMRRSQPNCATFILTGYPAFESALKSIQAHVDDYLVKPTDVETLVAKIEERLKAPNATREIPRKSVAALLRENVDDIKLRVLKAMKADPELSRMPLSDEQLVDYLPGVLTELADLLEPAKPGQEPGPSTTSARQHGIARRQQGYEVPMLFEEARLLQKAIFQVVQQHILELELSRLVSDLSLVTETLQLQLGVSSQAFLADNEEEAA